MRNDPLFVFNKLLRELKFDEVLDNYVLVVVYPEEKPSLRLDYVMTTSRGRQLQGKAPLPTIVFPIEDTWRKTKELRLKLSLLKGT